MSVVNYDAHRPGEVVSRATNDLDKMSESMQRGLLQLLAVSYTHLDVYKRQVVNYAANQLSAVGNSAVA